MIKAHILTYIETLIKKSLHRLNSVTRLINRRIRSRKYINDLDLLMRQNI